MPKAGGVTKTGALRLPLSLHKVLLGLFGALRFGSARFARLERSKFLHQAALAAGSIVLMNDTLPSSFIEHADRLQNGVLCLWGSFVESSTSLTDGSTSRTAHISIVQAALLVLTVSFDL